MRISIGQIWINKKSQKLYTILGFARHSETSEQMVIFMNSDFEKWVMPFDLFLEKFEKGK